MSPAITSQPTAPVTPADTTATSDGPCTATIPAMVEATAVPRRRGPRKFPTAATRTATPGRATLVTTGMATAEAASFNPLANAKASAVPTPRTSATSTDGVCPARARRAGDRPAQRRARISAVP